MKATIKRIGGSKFTEKFMVDILDTTAHKIGLVAAAVISIAAIILFGMLPLMSYQPTGWNIPDWMFNTVLQHVSFGFVFAVILYGTAILFFDYCYNQADPVEEYVEV